MYSKNSMQKSPRSSKHRSRSPLQQHFRSPNKRLARSQSRSPQRQSVKSPLKVHSRSPLGQQSVSHLRHQSKSPQKLSMINPQRSHLISPPKESTRRPVRSWSKIRARSWSRSPVRRSRSPARHRSRSLHRRSSRSPHRLPSRSPKRRSGKSPLCQWSRSPPRHSVSPLNHHPRSPLQQQSISLSKHSQNSPCLALGKDDKGTSNPKNVTPSSSRLTTISFNDHSIKKEDSLKDCLQLKISEPSKGSLTQNCYTPNNKCPIAKDLVNSINSSSHIVKDELEKLHEENNYCPLKTFDNKGLVHDVNISCNNIKLNVSEPVKLPVFNQPSSQETKIMQSRPQSRMKQTDVCSFSSANNLPGIQVFDKQAQSNEISSSIMSCESSKKVDNSNLNQCNYKNSDSNDSVNSLITTENEISGDETNLINLDPALREFDISDDLNESDCDNNDDICQSNSSEYDTVEAEVAVEEIDAMLEEGLPEKLKESCEDGQPISKIRHKIVLEEIGHNHFDLLPEGWIQITHSCGMPVYLHKISRVCTMSRPYYLGPGSSRNHKVPLNAIPCLQYKRALEVEKKKKEEREKCVDQTQSHPELKLTTAHIETFEENEATQSLEISDLNEYCKKVFNFKTIPLLPFKSWKHRRNFSRMTRDLKRRQRPTLPGGTKLLKFPVPNGEGGNYKSECIINPNGKSYVCILHAYVQRALRKHPTYKFCELENPATPYSVTVYIGDVQYSVGVGATKKQAKVEAAKAALEVLIPEVVEKIERDREMHSGIAKRSVDNSNAISIFDQIKIEDPRVAEFCTKSAEPPPYAILLTCLSRNMALGEINTNYVMNSKKHNLDEFTMTVGNHKATVVCKNKREGKQKAAQAILQVLHPTITYWGSLLRLYGNQSIKNVKEKKQEEREITGLQCKASPNQPNYAILEKLKNEMRKLRQMKEAITSKGKFTLPKNVILPSLSDLNKVNLRI